MGEAPELAAKRLDVVSRAFWRGGALSSRAGDEIRSDKLLHTTLAQNGRRRVEHEKLSDVDDDVRRAGRSSRRRGRDRRAALGET